MSRSTPNIPQRKQPVRTDSQQSPYRSSEGQAVTGGSQSQPRKRNYCLTCRMRRKSCSNAMQPDLPCSTCRRLHIECLGWSNKRPRWMTDSVVTAMRADIKGFTRPLQPSGQSSFSLSKYYENDPTFKPPFPIKEPEGHALYTQSHPRPTEEFASPK